MVYILFITIDVTEMVCGYTGPDFSLWKLQVNTVFFDLESESGGKEGDSVQNEHKQRTKQIKEEIGASDR